MKIDIKTLRYAARQHGVACELNGATLELDRKKFALQGRFTVRPGTGVELISEENLSVLGELLPSAQKDAVLTTYTKVMHVKLAYCKTEMTEVEI